MSARPPACSPLPGAAGRTSDGRHLYTPPVSLRGRRLATTACVAVVLSYVVLVAAQIGQQWPPDFATFYAVARALARGQTGGYPQLYTLGFQVHAFSILGQGHLRVFNELFLNPPPAVWLVTPWTLLSLKAAFFSWDAVGLGLAAIGIVCLARQSQLQGDTSLLCLACLASYPLYLALGEGQYDLLWPIALALAASAIPPQPSSRVWLKAGLSALICATKPELLVLLIVPAVAAWRQRVVRYFAVAAGLLAIISYALIGPSGLLAAVHLESYNQDQRFTPLADSTALSVFWHVFGGGRLATGLGWAALLLGIVCFGVAWWRNPPTTTIGWQLSLTSAVCLSLLLSPHTLGHSLTVLVGPLIWSASALRRSGRTLTPLVPWFAALNLALVLDNTPRVALPLPLTPLVLLAAAVIAWRARSRLDVGGLEAGRAPVVASPAAVLWDG